MTGTAWEHQREVRAALQTFVSDPHLGIAALSDPQTMSNLLKDLLPDAPREIRVLVAAAEAGLARLLLDHVSQGMDAVTAASLAAGPLPASSPRITCAVTGTMTQSSRPSRRTRPPRAG